MLDSWHKMSSSRRGRLIRKGAGVDSQLGRRILELLDSSCPTGDDALGDLKVASLDIRHGWGTLANPWTEWKIAHPWMSAVVPGSRSTQAFP